ncbi:MAG: RpiB/LacA/LacB family sugar-phosphate isomerase [bacterium]
MIYIGADHRGYNLKEEIKNYFELNNIKFEDCGNKILDNNDDFPDYAFIVGEKVASNMNDLGILICGSGEGMTIAANKVKGVRAALCDNVDSAKQSRFDNDANILVMNERHIIEEAIEIIDVFVKTKFSSEERYIRRIDKISKYESNN